MLPKDNYAFVGPPPLMRPEADEVHISCTFTWDKPEAEMLQQAWSQYYPTVRLGGPAYASIQTPFEPGKYIAPGVTFTSRGCNNHCPWCLVPESEGKLFQYMDFMPGHIIQDNNLLQCERSHIERVFEMLRYQGTAVTFSGGLESRLVTDWFIEELKTIYVKQIFLACDTKAAIVPLRDAIRRIGLPRDKIRCYVLLGFDVKETIESATSHLMEVWEAGALPFPQLYQPEDLWISYPKMWRDLQRRWSRPAITKAQMRKAGATECREKLKNAVKVLQGIQGIKGIKGEN